MKLLFWRFCKDRDPTFEYTRLGSSQWLASVANTYVNYYISCTCRSVFFAALAMRQRIGPRIIAMAIPLAASYWS